MTVIEAFRDWVYSDEFPVVVTAIVLGIPSAYIVQDALNGSTAFGFLLLLALGVGVPRQYGYWPATYDRGRTVLWAVGACAVMTAEMVAIYLVVSPAAGEMVAAIAAFVLADLGNTVALTVLGDTTPN